MGGALPNLPGNNRGRGPASAEHTPTLQRVWRAPSIHAVMAPSGPGSVSSGAPSSEGGSQASWESLGVFDCDGGDGTDADLLRGNSSSR